MTIRQALLSGCEQTWQHAVDNCLEVIWWLSECTAVKYWEGAIK